MIKHIVAWKFKDEAEGHTKEELAELVLEHKTLAEMIDYAFNEETLMYSKLTEPQITIDLSQDTRAYFAHDTMNMYVEANIKSDKPRKWTIRKLRELGLR